MSTLVARMLVILVGIILFVPFLGDVHLFDWDEINFAESAREMVMSGEYLRVQINYQPFWEKPPLFIWMQALSMKAFGINEFAARFPNAIVGVFTLFSLFEMGRKLINQKFGLLWALAYIGTFLPHFYFKSGIIDPMFNLFIMLGVYRLHRFTDYTRMFQKGGAEWKSIKHLFLAGIYIGLAILTKGPVAFLLVILTAFIYVMIRMRAQVAMFGYLFIFGLVVVVTASFWFGIDTYYNGPWFTEEFLKYNYRLMSTEDSGHGQPFFYHPLVLLIGCFPVSVFFFAALREEKDTDPTLSSYVLWMKVFFWVVLILFSIVKTKIVHYSSLCYFPLTFLGAYMIYKLYQRNAKVPGWIIASLAFLCVLLSGVIVAVSLIPRYKSKIVPLIADDFAKANIMANVSWMGYEWIIGVFLFIVSVFAFFTYRNPIRFAIIIFAGVAITLQSVFYFIVPKLEQHIQGPMIRFYESVKDENCYVYVAGFKSYAQYFYTNRRPDYFSNPRADDEQWLIECDIDKPAYIMTKNDRDRFKDHPNLTKVVDEGGILVYKRSMGK